MGVFFRIILLTLLFFSSLHSLAAQAAPVLLEEMTWPEIEAALKSGVDTVVITVGATEQHGPQIALSSDSVVGDYMGPAVARALGRSLVAPNIRLGVSAHHMMFPGTITVRSEVLFDLLREYVHSLAWHGFRHIVILPTHGGNFTTIARLDQEISPLYPHLNIIGYSDAESYIRTIQETTRRLGIDPEAAGSHSGLSETSQILALRPELVRMDRAAVGFMGDAYGVGERMTEEGTHSVTSNGVFGDPRKSTAEVGREYLQDLARLLTAYARQQRESWEPSVPADLPAAGLKEPSGPLAEGVRRRRGGDLEGAQDYFKARLGNSSQATEARLELVKTLILREDFGKAREELQPLLASTDSGTREKALDELALLEQYHANFDAAIAAKKEAGKIRAAAGDRLGQAHKLFYVAYVQTQAGLPEQAAQTYREALALTPGVNDIQLDLHHLEGLLDVSRGRLLKAAGHLRALEDAVLKKEFAGHVRRFYHLQGEILLARGRVQEALLNFPPAIQIYDHPLYRESLGRAYAEAGRLEEATREFQHLLNLKDPRLDIPSHYVRAHYSLGKVYEASGKKREAQAMYRKFLGFWGENGASLPSVVDARSRMEKLLRE